MKECKISEESARELLDAFVKNGEVAKQGVEVTKEAVRKLGKLLRQDETDKV
jgi:hypothetical protein